MRRLAPLLALLAAEITAATGKDPGQHYAEITAVHGNPLYTRIDQAATPAEKSKLKQLSPAQVKSSSLAGEPIVAILTKAPGNGAAIGGIKVIAKSGWYAARPSGTEDIYKIYAESFSGAEHLQREHALRCGGVDGIAQGAEVRALRLQLFDDTEQMPDRAREAVEPGQPALVKLDDAPLKAWAARLSKEIDQTVQDARFAFSASRMAASASKTMSTTVGASPSEGSSSSSTSGSATSARAIASCCCWPPESTPAWRFRNSSTIGKRL